MFRQPLTIAIASSQRQWHGGEEQARLLALGLRQGGCRCAMYARRGGEFARRMAAEGFEVFTFAGRGRSPATLWQLRRQLRHIGPEVLHYNDSNAITSVGLAAIGLPIAARIAARRTIFPLRSSLSYRWFGDRVICVSREVARVCSSGGVPDAILRVVHDGVDPARAASGDRQRGRQSLGLADDDLLLLTVAKLTDCKGHRFLMEALPAVLQKYPRAIAALAGDGELLDSLQQQAQRLGIQRQLRFLGYRQDVPDLIHAADLFVLPSHKEGLCSTLIDVMLAGRTIVTTTAGGIPDLTGSDDPSAEPVAWTVPPCDAAALAGAILDALDSPQVCAAMQQRARQRAERLFTAERMIDATLAVYREVIATKQPR